MGFVQDGRSRTASAWPLILLRLSLGPVWIKTGLYWLTNDDPAASMVKQITGRLEAERTYDFFRPFLEQLVIPNAELFAFLLTWGELLAGISLLLGAATRLGAAVGMFLALNYTFMWGNSLFPISGNPQIFVLCLIIALGSAGRVFGVDYFLHRRWPHVPIW